MSNLEEGGIISVKLCKESVLCKRDSKCKNPVAEMIMMCSKKRKKAIVAVGKLEIGERMEAHEIVEIVRGQMM